jgi:hypothetical protein
MIVTIPSWVEIKPLLQVSSTAPQCLQKDGQPSHCP